MKKLVKWLMAALGAVVVVFVIAALVLPQVIDPNDYKQEIRDRVHAQTGRALNIGGQIKWSVFPWIGLDIRDVSLDNRNGFGKRPMIKVAKIAVSLKLMPLFHRAIELGSVELDDMSVYLRKDAAGRSNWDDLSNAATRPTTKSEGGGGDIQSLKLASIRINNANITWDNAGQIARLKDFHVNASNIELGRPFDLKGGFSVILAEAALDLDVSANVDIDRANDQVKLTNVALRLYELVLNGQMTVHALSGTPRIEGDLKLAEFSPRALLKAMGIETAPGAGEEALGSMAGEVHFIGSSKSAALKNLRLKLDHSNITGNLKIEDYDHPRLAFDFQADRFNLDDYRGNGEESETSDDLAADVFRGFTGGGTIKIGQLIVAGLNATDVELTLRGDGEGIRFYPVNAAFYGGKHTGDFRIDARGDRPMLVAKQQLTDIKTAGLLQDLAGTSRLEGTGNLKVDLRTDLSNARSTRKLLSGKLTLNVHDGAIVGIDITESLRKASALLGRQSETPGAAGQDSKTEFSDLSMTATIKQGIVHNDDLVLRSPLLRMTGKGRINLVTETIDYRVKPVLEEDVAGISNPQLDKIQGVPIPIRLSGNLYDPSIKVDIAAALSASQKAKIETKKDELKDKVLGKLLGGKDDQDNNNTDQSGREKPDDNGDSDTSSKDLLKGLFGSKEKKDNKDDDGG